MPDPQTYAHDGTMRYRNWRMLLRAVVDAEADAFPTARSLLMWGYGRLSGKAQELMGPWMEEREAREALTIYDFEEFVSFCDTLFDDQDLRRRQQAAFFNMRQAGRSFFEFFADWSQTLVAAGLVLGDEAKERALLAALDGSFRKRADMVLVTIEGFAAKVEFLKKAADAEEAGRSYAAAQQQQQQAQQQQRGRGRGQGTTPKASGGGGGGGAPAQQAAAADPDAMEWEPTPANAQRARWTTPEEREKRRAAGQCLRCGATGHNQWQCAALPARRPAVATPGPTQGARAAAMARAKPDPAGVEEAGDDDEKTVAGNE
jgi:hypothetical protein